MSLDNIVRSELFKKSLIIAKPFALLSSYVVLHEYLHGWTALALGGEFNNVSFTEGIICDCSPPNSENYLLHRGIINLSPNTLLGVPGMHMLKNEIKSFKGYRGIVSKVSSLFTLGVISVGYIPLAYGIGDAFGFGGNDFINAGENLREFFTNQYPFIKDYIGEIGKTTQTLSMVGVSLGISFFGYHITDKMCRKIKKFYRKNK